MNGFFDNDADPRADLTLGQRIFHLGMLLRRAEFGPDKPPFGRGRLRTPHIPGAGEGACSPGYA